MAIKRDRNRQTGKTFRRLLEALKLASEGWDVVYVAISQHECDWLWMRAERLGRMYGLGDSVRFYSASNKVHFRDAGTIHFQSNQDQSLTAKARIGMCSSRGMCKVIRDVE